jgi:hypothetical protein
MPTQTEIATNKAVLDSVDAKMAALDAAIVKLDDLVAKHVALSESLASLRKQEIQHLRDDTADENAAVERLIQLRARCDVQSARVASLDSQIKEQRAQVIAIGNSAGEAAHNLWHQLKGNRTARATRVFDSNFEMPWAAHFPKSQFIESSKLVVAIANLSMPSFTDHSRKTDDRIEQLRHFAKGFVPLREHLLAEPDLVLVPVGTPSLSVVSKAA